AGTSDFPQTVREIIVAMPSPQGASENVGGGQPRIVALAPPGDVPVAGVQIVSANVAAARPVTRIAGDTLAPPETPRVAETAALYINGVRGGQADPPANGVTPVSASVQLAGSYGQSRPTAPADAAIANSADI